MRIVFDTGVLVSRAIDAGSVPGRAQAKAIAGHELLVSEALMVELLVVLQRPKLSRYVDEDDVTALIQLLAGAGELVAVTAHVAACRDPDDDHVLALAVSGLADAIVSGDADLLVLHPFQGIRILTPRQFLTESEPMAAARRPPSDE